MRQILLYDPYRSFLHRMDPRCKLAALGGMSLSAAGAGFHAMILLGFVLAVLFIIGRVPLLSLVRSLRIFFLFLALLFLARAAATPGEEALRFLNVGLSREGMEEGGLLVLRLFEVTLAGIVFAATTSPEEVRGALEWFLRPVPFLPEARIAAMVGLLLRLIPLVFGAAATVSDAQKARGVENRKNPFYRLKSLAAPLVRATFGRAENLALAMTARCYSDQRTPVVLRARTRDFLAAGGLIVIGFSARLL